jgi:hypothetical protein
MKKFIGLVIVILLMSVAYYIIGIPNVFAPKIPDASLNPDPNHTHADFAIWINNTQVDYSGDEYMSGLSTDDATHDEEEEYKHKHLHLHDNVGHVIHRHKPGLVLNDFLRSLGILHAENCLAVQNTSYCDNWQMFVNGMKVTFDPMYEFADLDKVLLTFNANEQQLAAQLEALTDDACLYSKACPWRGDPPAENCVADPEVPCVAPLD